MLEGELRHEIPTVCGKNVALPMQCEVLRHQNLHHMAFAAVAHGAGEGRSASLCVWLVAAADKRGCTVLGELALSPSRISPLRLFNRRWTCKLCLSKVRSSNLFKRRGAKYRALL
jgi:hypothetical protein